MSDRDETAALALVHRGWEHLRLQRPLAAWASWQQALRSAPGDRAATEALERLGASPFLPQVARTPHRLRSPETEERRRRWDQALRRGDSQDIAGAQEVFEGLAKLDPADGAAWFNLGLCHAWRGENLAALRALHTAVLLTAEADPDPAADAWMLAEILRHGAGAEPHADDLSWTIPIARDDDDDSPPRRWLEAWPHREIPSAPDPLHPDRRPPRIFELLNLSPEELPRVEASLVVEPGRLRFTTLWPGPGRPWAQVLEEARETLGIEDASIGEAEAHVLPLHLLDSQALAFRVPEGLDPEERGVRIGEALRRYYESEWAGLPRHGLASGEPDAERSESPWDAARRVGAGDAVAAAKLEGVIRLREQLARRPGAAPLYDGFSFDAIRVHLGLPPRWTDSEKELNRDAAAE